MAGNARSHENGAEREHILQAIVDGDDAVVRSDLARSHPAEVADILEAIEPSQRQRLWRMIPPQARGEVLLQVHSPVRDQLIGFAKPAELIDAVGRLQADKFADLDAQLPPEILGAALQAMDADRKLRYERLRSYPDDTAGGLMDADALTVRADTPLRLVQHYLQDLRRRVGKLPEHLDSLMVVEANGTYVGVVGLAEVVSLDPGCTVREAMIPGATAVRIDTPAARVARLFEDHDWSSAAVVDTQGRLVGRITVDDVIDVIRREGEEAALHAAGLSSATDLLAPVTTNAKRRALWLGINLLNGFVAAWVIHLFDAAIEKAVALAVLMPIVAGMGGVCGIQTLTLVTRGLALEQVNPANARLIFLNELGTALVSGAFWALLVGIVAAVWLDNTGLALVFALALMLNMLNGACAGTVIPLLLRRLGIDPALAGGVVLTAATDILGFACFLGMAAAWLAA